MNDDLRCSECKQALTAEVERDQERTTNTHQTEEIEALRRGAAQAVRERDAAAALAIERDRLNTPLKDALRSLFQLVEDGTLVRDVTRDGEPGWPLKVLAVVSSLRNAQALLSSGSPSVTVPAVAGTTSDKASICKPPAGQP